MIHEKLIKRILILAGIIIIAVLIIPSNDSVSEMESDTEDEVLTDTEVPDSDPEMITVYICGEVKNPGVYELGSDSRVVDILEMAGGFTENASQKGINLAQSLTDGEMVYIPSPEDEVSSGSDEDDGHININTADVAKLMTLPGIGESKAKAIRDYIDTNGKLSSIEDIMNIPGIKAGVYSNIKDYITVN